MSVPPGDIHLRIPASLTRSNGGFTLFGAVLGVTALGLAIAVGVIEFRKFQHRAHRDQFVADLKAIAKTFEDYNAAQNEWAPGTHPEMRIPRGMETVLAQTAWSAGPPFGGTYDWIPPQVPLPEPPPPPKPPVAFVDPDAPALPESDPAAPKVEPKVVPKPAPPPPRPGMIAVSAFSPSRPLALSEADLRYIDEKLDDGNLATGRFRTGFNRWPVYLINSRP